MKNQNKLILSAFLSEEQCVSLPVYFKVMRLLDFEIIPFSQEFMHFVPELSHRKEKFLANREAIQRNLEDDYHVNRRWITPEDTYFPQKLLELEEVPFILRVEGDFVWRASNGLAVVGSRDPQSYSIQWMEKYLHEFLSCRNCYIASGGARGVDQKAHFLALETKRPTLVFLPSGLDKVYPPNLNRFKSEIISQGGTFISEYSSDMEIKKHHFIRRNRLISGIAEATLIVEARQKSGTMITAREAIDQHRPLWIVPGHPLDLAMEGNNELLIAGATPIINAQDLKCLFDSETLSKNLPAENFTPL